MSQIEEIKSRIDIVDLIGESVKLRRTGRNHAGLCPFHSEKTPSFMVSQERQTWRCFGQCNEGGDIFSFLMKKEGWDFPETLRFLAQKAGIQLQEYHPGRAEEKEEHERLRLALEEAVTFFHHQLLNTEEGKHALSYLKQERHLNDGTLETFGLGYAPRGWDNLLNHLGNKDFTQQEMLDCGLVSERASGEEGKENIYDRHVFDRFRERIMIPIRDTNGKMVGFGARILNPDDFPKFLNSPETSLFSKSRILYGLNQARRAIRAADQAIIVEGYLDVIALHQAGFRNAVSPMGTALTEDQLRLLKRFSRRIVMAMDPDAAGQKAVLSGLESARQALDREVETGFDARGLLHHETRLKADLRVVTMPDGMDPDEIVQQDPDQWKKLVANAQPVVIHVMQTLGAGRDLDDAKTKSEIASHVLPLIEDIFNPIERDSYRQRLARFLKVDERTLVTSERFEGKGGKTKRRYLDQISSSKQIPAQELKRDVVSPVQKLEAHLLGHLVHQPDWLCRLDRALQENKLGCISAEDFTDTDHQILFQLVRESLEQDMEEPDRYLITHLPEYLGEKVGMWLEEATKVEREDHLLEDLFRSILAIRRHSINENINQVRFLIEEGQLMDDPYNQMIIEFTRTRQMLDNARVLKNGNQILHVKHSKEKI